MTMITIKSVLMMTIAVQPLVQNLGAWDGFLESKPFCSKVGFTNSKARPTSIQCQKSRFKLSQKKFKFSILERALIGLIASKLRFRVNCWKNYLSQCTLWLMHFRPAMILQMSPVNNMCLLVLRIFFSVLSLISAFVLRSSAIYLPNWKIIAVEGVERDFWVAADVLQRTGRHRFFFRPDLRVIFFLFWLFAVHPALTFCLQLLMDSSSVDRVSLRNKHCLSAVIRHCATSGPFCN